MDGSIDPVEHPRAGAHRRLLVIPGFWSAITVLAIFLLFAFAATAAEVVEPIICFSGQSRGPVVDIVQVAQLLTPRSR